MMKKLMIGCLLILCLLMCGCKGKYVGYYCRYNETATIVVLLEKDISEDNRKKIEEKINSFLNIERVNYYSVEDYASHLGESPENLDIYGTYVVLFDSLDSIGSYIEILEKMDGVRSATQSNAKTNMSLYNLKKNKTYTYTNSDEASEEDLITGKYKIKNGAIVFTPDDKEIDGSILYIKDGLLCGDVDCNLIYAESDETCK